MKKSVLIFLAVLVLVVFAFYIQTELQNPTETVAQDQNEKNNPAPKEQDKETSNPPDEEKEIILKEETPTQPEKNTQKVNLITNPADLLVLVNKNNALPSDYTPADLVVPDIPFAFEGSNPKKQIRAKAAEALEKLFQKAQEENIDLLGLSGYRSYQRQKSIFTYKAQQIGEEEANKISARPGQSEHQTGLAMDVTSPSVNNKLVTKFGQTTEGKWLKDNCAEFGFIIRYPQDKVEITQYSYEPWHLRYIGVEAAKTITSQSITLEEFLRG